MSIFISMKPMLCRSIECGGLLWLGRSTESVYGIRPVLYKCRHGLCTLVVRRTVHTIQMH